MPQKKRKQRNWAPVMPRKLSVEPFVSAGQKTPRIF
jgi:hypothetical protein